MFGFERLERERQGEVIIFSESILWSLFPVITILSLVNISPLLSLAWSTLFAAVFFGIVLSVKNGWKELRNKAAIKDILITTFLLGIVYYGLFFTGLRYTTAGNASLIQLTEIFFSFLFFNIWRKEYFSLAHIAGAILMLAGSIIIFYPSIHGIQIGDLLILLACFISPFGNYFQRRARKQVKSETILFIRSLISAPVIFILAYLTRVNFSELDLGKSFVFLIINGFFLLGLSKILWVEGIHRISVTKASALNSVTPLLTLLFAWILLGNIPTKFQLLAFIPMIFGVILLGTNKKVESVIIVE
ncbi:MAG: DMT family transporter [Candidatus Moraniibacteriota bacterium]